MLNRHTHTHIHHQQHKQITHARLFTASFWSMHSTFGRLILLLLACLFCVPVVLEPICIHSDNNVSTKIGRLVHYPNSKQVEDTKHIFVQQKGIHTNIFK